MFRHPSTQVLRSFFVLLLTLISCSFAHAAYFVVSTTADSGAGSLRQAILSSNSPAGGEHTISFSAAFPANGVILLNSNLPQIVSQSLIIEGGNKQPRIDGQSLRALFSVSSGTTVFELSDLVLQNALAPEHGACINSGSSGEIGRLYAERVTFSNCKASGTSLIRGGAIYWNRSAGSVSAVDSQFLSNSVEATASSGESSGGALYTNADLSVVRTLFEDNDALSTSGGGIGGAIAVSGSGSFGSITESTFRFNDASQASALFGYGGGVYVGCDDCSMQIVRSYLRGNTANYGGAVYARKTSAGTTDVYLTLANSTFYHNAVPQEGAAVYVGSRASLSAANNTFYDSFAASGAHLGFSNIAEVNFFRANLLAPTSTGSNCVGTPTIINPGFVSFNLFTDTSCASLSAGSLPDSPLGVITVDETPGLIGVVRFSGSAVIDSITAASICAGTDARGQNRPIDGDGDGTAYCDVGAYEYQVVVFIDSFET